MINQVFTYVCGAVVAASLALAGVQTYRVSVVQNQLLNERLKHASELDRQKTAHIQALSEAKKVSDDLQETFNRERDTFKSQVASANAVASDLRKRLQNATAAANAAKYGIHNSTGNGKIGLVFNGAFLPSASAGSDVPATYSEVDVDEAERADKIRLSLLSCYKQYDEVRAKVNNFKVEPGSQHTNQPSPSE